MAFKGKGSFYGTGLAALLLGVALNFIGFIYLPKYHLSTTYPSDIYWTNTLNLVGIGLVLIGLAVIFVGALREE